MPEREGNVQRAVTEHSLVGSDRVTGTRVFDVDGKRMGLVRRLMINKTTGQVEYAILATKTWFGVDFEYHAANWSSLAYDSELAAYRLRPNDSLLSCTDRNDLFDWGVRNQPRFWFFSGP